jgi:uncharacterized protein YbjT (DUF2867 family)
MTRLFLAAADTPAGRAVSEGLAGSGFDIATDSPDTDPVAAMREADVLVLVSPLEETLVRQGFDLVNAAKEAGIGHVVRISLYASANDAHWRLGRELGRVDLAVEESGLPYTILRPSMLMQTLPTPAELNGVLRIPSGDAAVSYLDGRDLAACVEAVLSDKEAHNGRTYAVTGPQGLSMNDLVQTMGEVSDKLPNAEALEENDYLAVLSEQGFDEWSRNMLLSLSRIAKRGMAGNVTGAVRHITGRDPHSYADYLASLEPE